jgi:hypothetical protein
MHGTTDHTSTRERILQGFDFFQDVIGHDPRTYVNHVGQREAIYWGKDRLDGLVKYLYCWAHRLRGRSRESFSGHIPDSPWFWGDICRERVTYVRNLVFKGVDTLANDPWMPYHDPRRPYVRYWFSSSEASKPRHFRELLHPDQQDRLVESGGACIAYTHFGFGFVRSARIDPEVRASIKRLANLPGWFVPVSTLLDHLRSCRGHQEHVNPWRLELMQCRWLLSKLRGGTS